VPQAKVAIIQVCSPYSGNAADVQGDSKLLSGFPWPIIFKPETIK
jgi:hypothetical protein